MLPRQSRQLEQRDDSEVTPVNLQVVMRNPDSSPSCVAKPMALLAPQNGRSSDRARRRSVEDVAC